MLTLHDGTASRHFQPIVVVKSKLLLYNPSCMQFKISNLIILFCKSVASLTMDISESVAERNIY